MLRWPLDAGRAVARLFQALQDIDVFVEDQNDEEFYTRLFSIAANGRARIAKVIGLGGRGPVEAAAASHNSSRPSLYLIDGDLSWVRGEPATPQPRLYQLNCYCIENVLIAREGASALVEEEAACSMLDAEGLLDFDVWSGSMQGLVELSIRFAVLNKIDPSVTTVSGALGLVIVAPSKGLPSLCTIKLAGEVKRVEGEIVRRVGQADCDARVAAVRARVQGLANPLLAVSGKEFLLPLLGFHIKSVTRSRVRNEVLRFRLAKNATAGDLVELSDALRRAS